MKRILLGSSALMGAALLAQPAAAQLEVSVSGSVSFSVGYADGEGDDYADFRTDPEILIDARGTADNGLNYAARVDFDADPDANNAIDEAWITLRGSWGSLVFGDEDGAADEMDVYAPTFGVGQFDGDGLPLAAGLDGANGDQLDDFFYSPVYDGDNTKISYYTPRFAGFQVGLSYSPRNDDGNSFVFAANPEPFYQVGVNYVGDFGPAHVTASGVYAATGDDPDIDGWAVGIQAGFGPFTVGGNYTDRDDATGTADQEGFTVGATYSLGPWTFGGSYLWNDFDNAADDGSASFVGLNYTIAPGLSVGADVGYLETDDDEAFVTVTQLTAAF